MTISKQPKEAYVWIWLPEHTEPVVAGKLTIEGKNILFNYGKSYLDRPNAIAIYTIELPLKAGLLSPLAGLTIPGCIRDAAPDAWGRRVIIHRLLGLQKNSTKNFSLDELTYLLESGSDRIGALDFQLSPTEYQPRFAKGATLDELFVAAERVERNIALTPELAQALYHGTSIGGARPKALLEDNNQKYIAKFSSSSDLYSIVKAEFIAMRLAKLVGLNVAPVSLTKTHNKDILLIKRFDRVKTANGWQRKIMLSALTLFTLDEMMARYASYETLAEIIRHHFTNAKDTLRELFARIIFNILCGNTDDHARNHAAFWDGNMLTLTPAYDICPQMRSGNEASQAMLISGSNRMSKIVVCLDAAAKFLLSRKEALTIVDQQINIIAEQWYNICDEAELSNNERKLFWQRQFLNAYIFEGLTKEDKEQIDYFRLI